MKESKNFIFILYSVNGGTTKYLVDDNKYLHPMSEDNKFSPVICQMTSDDQSIMKSSPNSQPTLSQLTTANLHMEMEDASAVIKNEEANYAMPFMH